MNLNRINPNMLKPASEILRGSICDSCNKGQASWIAEIPRGDEDRIYVCSLCVLYKTDWGKKAHERVEVTIGAIERARGKDFVLGPDKRLASPRDADDVLGSITLALRLESVQNTMKLLSRESTRRSRSWVSSLRIFFCGAAPRLLSPVQNVADKNREV